MSDNVTTARQRSCTTLVCEHQKYVVDIFSYLEPGHQGHNGARKQLFLYIARAEGNGGRKAFLQVITKLKNSIFPSTYDVPIVYLHLRRGDLDQS